MAQPHLKQEILIAAGYAREQAVERIGAALVEEIWWMMREHRDFDREHFRTLLLVASAEQTARQGI
jgi:hypothetical protein